MKRRVVITGIGCLSPNGLEKADFFQALVQGKSGIKRIQRFDPEGLACQIAGEIQDGFDPWVWISRKDKPHVSRIVPMALAATQQALTDANVDPTLLSLAERQRFGVLLGSGGGSVEFTEQQYQLYFAGALNKATVYAIPANTMGALSSEISMRHQLHGLSHVISTGCTSSTDAVGYAMQHIQAGRLDRVICGGADAPITPGVLTGFCMMRVVSPSWNHQPEQGSRPFSRDRDGFVLGEGAWMFLLEERELALSRGAKPYAELMGYGATCEAYHRVAMDASGTESARAMTDALSDAGIPAEAIQYVNAHGTATALNDRVETRAIHQAFGPHALCLAISSTKSMIGHPQGASGAAGIATALCAMETGIVPPTRNLDNSDPECDLDYVPDIGRRLDVAWALCNCLGFGSKNSAVVLKRFEG